VNENNYAVVQRLGTLIVPMLHCMDFTDSSVIAQRRNENMLRRWWNIKMNVEELLFWSQLM